MEDQHDDYDQQPLIELKGLLALLGERWNSVSKRADDWQTLLDTSVIVRQIRVHCYQLFHILVNYYLVLSTAKV